MQDAERFIALALSKDPPTFFAIECGGRVAGGIGYTLHQDVERVGAEVGYWLGRGLGTAALKALTQHAFATHAFLRRLYAVPYATNPASARLLEKAGFRLEGTMRQSAIKNGVVLDQWLYAVLREA